MRLRRAGGRQVPASCSSPLRAHHTQNGETQCVRPAVLRISCDYGFVAGFFIMDVIGA